MLPQCVLCHPTSPMQKAGKGQVRYLALVIQTSGYFSLKRESYSGRINNSRTFFY